MKTTKENGSFSNEKKESKTLFGRKISQKSNEKTRGEEAK